MATATALKPIELMSVGTRKSYSGQSYTFTDADLQAIAANFTAAPFVPGHPKDDQPQVGQATKVEVRDGKLVATKYTDVDPTFKSVVNSGELSRISVKLRLPDHPENTTGTYEIAHIGFLGKSAPADTGIGEAAFSVGEFEAEFAAPLPQSVEKQETDPMAEAEKAAKLEAEFAAKLQAIEEKEAALAAKEAEFQAEFARFTRINAATPWVDAQVAAGTVLPGERDGLIALFAVLPDEVEVCFSQGDDEVKTSASAYLKSFIKGLGKRIEYGEVARATDEAEFAKGEDKDEDYLTMARKKMWKAYKKGG